MSKEYDSLLMIVNTSQVMFKLQKRGYNFKELTEVLEPKERKLIEVHQEGRSLPGEMILPKGIVRKIAAACDCRIQDIAEYEALAKKRAQKIELRETPERNSSL